MNEGKAGREITATQAETCLQEDGDGSDTGKVDTCEWVLNTRRDSSPEGCVKDDWQVWVDTNASEGHSQAEAARPDEQVLMPSVQGGR